MIDAASAGASAAIGLVANIAACLISFFAILHFLNTTLTWFGLRVGIDDPVLTFEVFIVIELAYLWMYTKQRIRHS